MSRRVLLTGFGPFGDSVKENPTEIMLRRFASGNYKVGPGLTVDTLVLQVSVGAVEELFQGGKQSDLSQRGEGLLDCPSSALPQSYDMIVHLGVFCGAREWRLESRAVDWFGEIPDERGYCWGPGRITDMKIVADDGFKPLRNSVNPRAEGLGLDATQQCGYSISSPNSVSSLSQERDATSASPRATSVPLLPLLHYMHDHGCKKSVVSGNAGSFLCNYVYYRSLGDCGPHRSLFIHVPDFPTDESDNCGMTLSEQEEYLLCLLEAIRQVIFGMG